ncbi:hypothetical protein FS842_011166 [Serendipita sp. 407]|nr:hypothetical protein FS842_011166 [Serendipita sp. 407]
MAFDSQKAVQRRTASPINFFSSVTSPARIGDQELEDSSVKAPMSQMLTYSPANDPNSASLFGVGTPLSLSTSVSTAPVPTMSTPSSLSGYGSPYVPTMNQISMPYIKRHAVKRVKSAKDACNAELQKVIHSITNYFEERLGEREREEAEEQYAKAQMQQQYMREQQIHSQIQSRDAMSEDGYQSAQLFIGSPSQVPAADLHAAIQRLHHSKREASTDGMTDADERTLSRSNSKRNVESTSRSHSRHPSFSALPGVRRSGSIQNKVPHSAPVAVPGSMQTGNSEHNVGNQGTGIIHQPTPLALGSQTSSIINPPATAPLPSVSQQQGHASKRISRHMHVPTANMPGNPQAPRSEISSRSTSRSRSPMPFSQGSTEQATPNSSSPRTTNRRLSRHLDSMSSEPPVDPYVSTLHELIGVCTDILEMSSSTLTTKPGMGSDLVRKVQEVGRAWDNHPDWYGRTWYITVLLAVATLARVVEWFEAERQFWNFEDDDEEGEAEPLTFVLKPEFEGSRYGGSQGSHEREESVPKTPLASNNPDENPLRLARDSGPGPEGRLSRDERVPQKDLRGGVLVGDQGPITPGKPLPPTPSAEPQQSPAPAAQQTPSAEQDQTPVARVAPAELVRVEDSEHLRQKADKAKSSNILMELNLDGEHFLYINRTWSDVIGSDPDVLVNTGIGISSLLHPDDQSKFKDASEKLQTDDSHTVEIEFRILVEDEDPDQSAISEPSARYHEMEGSGMLMLDRVDHVPSHTMWIIKPAPERTPPEEKTEDAAVPEPGSVSMTRTPSTAFRFPLQRVSTENIHQFTFPVLKSLSDTPILCRICENQIPSWFFEKHNETCAEVHKFEADTAECNESIAELRNTVRELISGIEKLGINIEKSIPERPVLEYRGMSISSPTTTAATNSPIQVFRPPLASRMGRVGVRKAQQRLLEQIEEILTTAGEISVPGLKDEEAKEPIERQRLLSPASEDRIGKCTNWLKPTPDDPALSRLVQDCDLLIKQKLDTVMRMQNTVRYSEKIRQEWTVKYEEALATLPLESSTIEPVEEEALEDAVQEGDDSASSTTSEYDFGRERLSTEPTPMASSPAQRSSTHLPPMPAPVPVPATYQGVGAHRHSRSSTPSSVTSPLAIAAPITATTPPAMDGTAALLAAVEDSAQTIRARRTSMQGAGNGSSLLDPKLLLVTPPISPLIGGTPAPISTAGHSGHARRLSIVQPILSPTVAVGSGSHHGRLPSVAPSAKAIPSSIKDFDIIKPISKGAFGSVFLAKKKTTGDYFAIKVLKKADMIAKNQITNVKAERMILMKQAESPFVVKLYFTFQSKDNLYLVMEYLNGGDCAALLKVIGSLPEEWTRAYVAEVVLGLEFLHDKGIVHRDLKPDNLLIDANGHLKLTDFGLSRIGLLGRQTRETRRLPERLLGGKAGRGRRSPGSRPTSFDSGYLQSPLLSAKIEDTGSYFNPRMAATTQAQLQDDVSESSGSEGVAHLMWRRGKQPQADSPLQSFASELATELRSQQGNSNNHSNNGAPSGTTPPAQEPKFVGTPDYLSPETILGLSEDDRCVDWWALGVITYEFLYGIPPFHAETPDKVFENILSMKIDWHEEWIEFSQAARHFMERLILYDPTKRLGYNGAKEVKDHAFFAEIEWDNVMQSRPQFVPEVSDPESTDYFDPRGAIPQLFQDDELVAINRPPSETGTLTESPTKPQAGAAAATRGPLRDAVAAPAPDDFGTFNFKNLPVLKQANDEVIKKLKSEQLSAVTHALGDAAAMHHRRRSISRRINKPAAVLTNFDTKSMTSPPSPSTSVSSIASSPSRGSMGPSTPGSAQAHMRRPSEYSAVDRFKMNQMDPDRRNSMPSRLRTASVSSSDHDATYATTESWSQSVGSSATSASPAPPEPKKATEAGSVDKSVVCLIAEDNPISAKILETLLVRLGCRCVMAADGAEAISTAHGDIKFDLILMDYHMPVVDGESAARYIKSTNNLNKSTPIVAVSAYVGQDSSVASNLFAACISKPVHKTDLLAVLRQLGFRTSTSEGPKTLTQVAKVAAAVS